MHSYSRGHVRWTSTIGAQMGWCRLDWKGSNFLRFRQWNAKTLAQNVVALAPSWVKAAIRIVFWPKYPLINWLRCIENSVIKAMQPSGQVYRTNQATLKSHEFESFGHRAKIWAKKARISRGRAVGVWKRE